MRSLRLVAIGALGLLGFAVQAPAQPVNAMLSGCSGVAQNYFRDWTARTEMQYNGQRVDGTYAINGRIFLETRFEDFACSYDRSGRRMVEFFVEGQLRNTHLPSGGGGGGGKPSGGGGTARVTGVPANDVLNVRSGPGTGNRIVGALANGDTVRNLGCQAQGSSRWCQIEMMTDMRERGWVNERYLTQRNAVHKQRPASAGSGGPSTVTVRFAPGSSGAEFPGSLAPGESRRYVLNARNGQNLTVRLATKGRNMSYTILTPYRGFLLDQVPAGQVYRGELWQSGDHVIEVINRGKRPQSYTVTFGVR